MYCGAWVTTTVADAVSRIQPEFRRGLKTAAQRNQRAVGDIVLRVPALFGLGAIDGDVDLGLIERLVHPQIGGAGNGLELIEKIDRELAVGFDIGAAHLNVDGRGQAEIEDLADDIGGHEVKRDARKFARQAFAQLADILAGGPVAFGQRNQNVRIHGADRLRGAVGHVDGAVRQADVVDHAGQFRRRNDAPDGGFHQIADARGFLDARAGLGAKVQIETARVGGREKILPQPGHQQKCRGARAQERRHENPAMPDAGAERAPERIARALECRARTLAEIAPPGSTAPLPARAGRQASADTSPASEPAFATARRRPASRTPRLRPAERTGSAPRRSERTWAETRCRCTASKPAPGTAICARAFENRRHHLPSGPGCARYSRSSPWRRPPECPRPAPARPAS